MPTLQPITIVFLESLPSERRAELASFAGLDAELDRLVAEARAAMPDLDPARFVGDVAARIGGSSALATIRAGDLALATACARGEPAALARFELELFGEIDAARARFRNASITTDELRQAMRDRLFVAGPEAAPRIASYQGRGDLRSWVRMATTRYLVDVLRADSARPDRPTGDDQLAAVATATDDPELAFLKQRYRVEFRAAFAEALGSLDPRARNILRHRYLDGLEIAELATIYGLHRVSMSRTLSRIRDELLSSIRRAFLTRLGVDQVELDGMMALIQSQLELSLSGLLKR